jgi:hypothetical protein
MAEKIQLVSTFRRLITVFGGTGFLGRRIVKHLLENEFAIRAVSRHPHRTISTFGSSTSGLTSLRADVHNEAEVAAALPPRRASRAWARERGTWSPARSKKGRRLCECMAERKARGDKPPESRPSFKTAWLRPAGTCTRDRQWLGPLSAHPRRSRCLMLRLKPDVASGSGLRLLETIIELGKLLRRRKIVTQSGRRS